MNALAQLLRSIGARTVDGIWRLGFATRFLVATLSHTPAAFRRLHLTIREVYFSGVQFGKVKGWHYTGKCLPWCRDLWRWRPPVDQK